MLKFCQYGLLEILYKKGGISPKGYEGYAQNRLIRFGICSDFLKGGGQLEKSTFSANQLLPCALFHNLSALQEEDFVVTLHIFLIDPVGNRQHPHIISE